MLLSAISHVNPSLWLFRILKVTQTVIQAEHIFIYKLSRVSSHTI